MSLQDLLHPTEPPPPTNMDATKDVKQPMRSWRKKFRKLKLRFGKAMDESNKLFMEEHKDIARARRIQEENDQLLELLLSLNSEDSLPERYSLGMAACDEDIGLEDYPQYTTFKQGTREFREMEEVTPHTRLSNGVLLEDVAGDKPPGYLDGAYEEEYLANVDAQFDESGAELPLQIRAPVSRQIPTEKDLYNANPNSVVSWLRRHHPETFIQEKDAEKEKAPAKPKGPGKRASVAAVSTPVSKAEPESHDDWDAPVEAKPAGGSGRGKRTKDDAPYRPKGGSSRPSKRKRADEGDKGPARGKRAKGSVATPS